MENQKVIELKDVSKAYQDKLVFQDFNLKISKNETTILMGDSGRGKTTLLNMMMGLESLDEGEIIGIESQKIVAVFQEDRLCESLSVQSNIKLVLNSKQKSEDILNHLESVGLEKELAAPVKNLSGGMKRRVAIVRAVMAQSDIIIMDEPFKGLDEATKLRCMDYIKHNTLGKTLIISTHDEREAEYFAGNIIKI
ncbi:MAG: ATP-binding cassette domain-containing protein [Proteocatella sp.]